jgi:NitT/TauT family transport system substrate-binding protein
MFIRVLAPLAVLALAVPSGARSADLTTVHLGLVPSMSAAPLFVADQLGYFKQEGLDVQVTTFPSAANMIAPLGAGQLDVGGGAAVASMYNAIGRGIDVRVVADLATDPPGYGFQRLIVRSDLVKSGRYKAVADLKGMTFANNARGVGAESQLNKLLEYGGLKFGDVHHVYMGFPDSVVAHKNSAIDAVVVPEPNATVAVQSGAGIDVMGDDVYYPNQEVAVVLYGTTFLRTNREAGMRFMRAFLRGVRYYNGALAKGKLAGPNADTVIKILTDNTPVKDPGIYRALTAGGSNPNGTINMASLKTDYDFYASDGLIDHAVDVNTVVDNAFVDDALKHLGLYKPAPAR